MPHAHKKKTRSLRPRSTKTGRLSKDLESEEIIADDDGDVSTDGDTCARCGCPRSSHEIGWECACGCVRFVS